MAKPTKKAEDQALEAGAESSEEDGGADNGRETPNSLREDKAAAALDALVAEASALPTPKLRDLRALIARGLEQNLAPSDMDHLLRAMSKSTKIAVQTLTQAECDVKNTDQTYGVLHNEAAVADAVRAMLRGTYEEAVWCAGCLWHWEADDGSNTPNAGYFGRTDPQELEQFLLQAFGHMPSMSSKAKRAEVIGRVKNHFYNSTFFDGAAKGLSLMDGFLSFDATSCSVEHLPADPRHKARSRVLVCYDPKAKAPIFRAGLARILGDPERVGAFQEFIGSALFGVTPGRDDARRALMLIGPAKTGKSTILNWLRELVPPYAVSAVPPGAWANESCLAMLSGKIFNFVTEVGGGKPIDGSLFKTVVSQEEVTARLLYHDPFSLWPEASHIFACNSVPRISGPDAAFERRILGLRFDRTLELGEVDPDYLDKVRGELPGVINWAVEGLLRVMRRGYYVLPPGHREIAAEMQHGDDLVARFAIQKVEKAAEIGRGVSTQELNAAMLEFAQQEDSAPGEWTPTTGALKLSGLLRLLYGAKRKVSHGIPRYHGVRLRREG